MFAVNDHQLGCLKDVTYHIDLNDPTPVKQRYRPLHPNLREKVQAQLKVMEETGVIQESTSPWSSPLTVATKKDGLEKTYYNYETVKLNCRKQFFVTKNYKKFRTIIADFEIK